MSATSTFPMAGLLPKKETKADRFLAKYPEYDGRGVKVAVFDTGVDPGAIGLQKTSIGEPKIVDIMDCSGAGDVILTDVPAGKVILNAENTAYEVEGLTGRQLKIPATWVRGEGAWQLGIKRIFELWPKSLVERIREERKKEFSKSHHAYEARAVAELATLERLKKLTPEQETTKSDLTSKLKATRSLLDAYDDHGPVCDCVVFRPKIETELDKTSQAHLPWAVIDTTETGALQTLNPMNAYKHSQQYGVFSPASLMSYSFNFYDANILSISVVSGTHGTHVAGIIAANYPDTPELNGIAPGAQILSMTIGDGRLGSMETSQSFMRAMNMAIELGADVINISYGEDSHIANNAPLLDYMRDIVIRKHRITVVSSAGNNGPGYATIGAPGGMTSSIISVGAYVSKEMANAQYALRDQAGDSAYTWSSRGPSIDGDRGVTIYAPGAAITCVPPYALNQTQLMNGTSMSSPNAAGGVALLISGLRSAAINYTPGSLSRSLVRAAVDVHDEFGTGLMDIIATYDDLEAGDKLSPDVYFDLVINGKDRGIMMRNAAELESAKVFSVDVKPSFLQEQTQEKFDFEQYLALESTEKWLEHASFVHLNNTGRAFQVKVDPTHLEPGLYITSIHARCTKSNKVIFSVPVTVIKPVIPSKDQQKKIKFEMKMKPGQIERRYLDIPVGVLGATIRTTTSDISTPIQIWTHVTQFNPDTRRTHTSTPFVQNFTSSAEAEEAKKVIKLIPGTAEFCFAQFWNSVAETTACVTVEIELHGIFGDYGTVLSLPGDSYKQIILKSIVGVEELKPAVRLEMVRKHLRPTSMNINTLGRRDVLDNTQALYSMILQYSVKFSRAGESQFILPQSGTLYENAFYSTLIQVFDDKKNRVHFTSTYPEKHKFEKKTYTVLVELVHADRAILETMKDQLLRVDSLLDKEVTLDVYDNYLKMWNKASDKFKSAKLSRGDTKSIVVACRTELPTEATFGDIMVGSIQLTSHKELKQPLLYTVPPAIIPKKEEEKSKTLLELQIDLASKITDKEEKHKFIEALSKENPKDLQVLSALLKESKDDQKDYVANSIIDLVDPESLAKYFGIAHKSSDDQSQEEKEEAVLMKRRKSCLVDAYAAKLEFIAAKEASEEKERSIKDTTAEYLKWIDEKSGQAQLTLAKSYTAQSLFGKALDMVLQALKSDLSTTEIEEAKKLRMTCLEGLKWHAWSKKFTDDQIGRDPAEFAPF